MKLRYHDRLDRVKSMKKIQQDNDMVDRIGTVYAKNENELPWSIRSLDVYDENQTKRVTECIGAVYVENDIELSWPIGLDAISD